MRRSLTNQYDLMELQESISFSTFAVATDTRDLRPQLQAAALTREVESIVNRHSMFPTSPVIWEKVPQEVGVENRNVGKVNQTF